METPLSCVRKLSCIFHAAYIARQGINGLVQHATRSSLAQPPTGSEPGITNTLSVTAKLITERLSSVSAKTGY